jgi:hypothetical protein
MNCTMKLCVVAGVAGAFLGACAPSGYSLQARNNYPQAVELRVVAQKGDQARLVENPQVAPGANITFHTKAERDEKVTLEARPAAEPQSAPAVYKMIVGLSRVVINPNADAGKDAKQPKVTIREER